jgi:hypothetical protein
MQVEMQENPASLVIWQTGTNAAIRHMPLDKFDRHAARRAEARQVAGRGLHPDETCSMCRPSSPRPTRKPTRRSWPMPPGTFPPACFAATTSCAAGTMTGCPYAQFVQLDGLHLNDFGQKCIGRLLTRSIVDALKAP